MGVNRQVGKIVLVLTIVSLLILTGCGTDNCDPDKSYEQIPQIKTVELYEDQPYTTQEYEVVGKKCLSRDYSELNNSRFSVSLGPPEWLTQPPVVGQTNYLRRVVKVYNAINEIDTIYLDKIYLYDGEETKRSRHALKFLVEPKSVRTLYVMWDTQYDPLKDVVVDFSNNTAELGFETSTMQLCINETKAINVTKYNKVKTGEKVETEGYRDLIRVKLKREC